MLLANNQPNPPGGSGSFEWFLPYMGMVVILNLES